ncbi:MAG: hypothetical protein NC307_15550 [Roseburia sp.]|nr:hypothetical protein [Roseburia sp.]
MKYSREEVSEEVDKTIVSLCEKCRERGINEQTVKLAHTLADLLEVRASMPDWREKTL